MGAAVSPKCGLLAAIILFVFLKFVFLIPVELTYSVVVSGVRCSDSTLLYVTAIIFNVSDHFFSSSGHSVILLP